MTSPITPRAARLQRALGGSPVIDYVNRRLVRWAGTGTIVVTQQEIASYLASLNIEEKTVLDAGLYDFEVAYEQAGWRVTWVPRATATEPHWVFEEDTAPQPKQRLRPYTLQFSDYLQSEQGMDPMGASDMLGDAMGWLRIQDLPWVARTSPAVWWEEFQKSSHWKRYYPDTEESPHG